MNLTLKFAQNPLCAFFLSFLILFTSCQPQELLDTSTETSVYNAEEIFKSIIFGDGEYVHKIPALQNLNILDNFKSKEQLNEFRNIQSEIIEYIKKRDKDYLNEFKKGVLSKNPMIISKTLQSASQYLIPYTNEKLALKGLTMEKVMADYEEHSSNKINAPRPQECLAEAIVIVIVAAVFIGVYLSVVYARYKYVTYPEQSRADDGSLGTSFGEEEIIASIIENF